jgi:hypothetical protein
VKEDQIVRTSLGNFLISEHLTKGLIFKDREMNWYSALEAVRKKGSAWSLPTLEQISTIHEESNFFDDIDGENVYWCLDEYEENLDCAFVYDLQVVMTGHWHKSTYDYMVIAIKPI